MRRDSDKPNRQHTRFDSLDLRPRRLEIFHTKTDGRRRLRLPSVCGCFAVAGKPAGSPSADAFRCRTASSASVRHENPSGARKFLRCTKRRSRFLRAEWYRDVAKVASGSLESGRSVFVHRENFRVGLGRFRVRRPGASSRNDAGRADGTDKRQLGQAASAKPSAARRPRPEVFV